MRFIAKETDYDIIAVTESWAKNEIADSELHIDGYITYRQDRSAPNKGGSVPGISKTHYTRNLCQTYLTVVLVIQSGPKYGIPTVAHIHSRGMLQKHFQSVSQSVLLITMPNYWT